MIAIIIGIYLFIGLLFTTWFLITGFSQEGTGEWYIKWFHSFGMSFVTIVSVMFAAGLGLFWPIPVTILLVRAIVNQRN